MSYSNLIKNATLLNSQVIDKRNNMSEPTLNNCNEPGFINNLNIDPPPPFCREGKSIKSSGTISQQPFSENQKDM